MAQGPLLEFLHAPSLMGNPSRRVVSARGTRVRFADGVEALCATSGLWNVNFGYGNETVARRVEPVLRDTHYATLFRYSHDIAHEAAQRLVDAVGRPYDRVFFSTSGSAANDAMMKLARHWSLLGGEQGRRIVVGLEGSYHGLTYGSMALSGDELGQELYGVDRRSIRHLSRSDKDEWIRFFDRHGSTVSAVVMEPVAGTGVHPLPDDLLETVLALRKQHGFLLVADEVATGFHRTGPLLASSRWPERPDTVIMSKGLTNGLAACAAILMTERVYERFERKDAMFIHAETQAGSPLASAAILGTLDFVASLEPERHVDQLTRRLEGKLRAVTDANTGLVTRGDGLFRFIGAAATTKDETDWLRLTDTMRKAGVVVHPGPQGIQVLPQVVSTPQDIDDLGDVLFSVLSDLSA